MGQPAVDSGGKVAKRLIIVVIRNRETHQSDNSTIKNLPRPCGRGICLEIWLRRNSLVVINDAESGAYRRRAAVDIPVCYRDRTRQHRYVNLAAPAESVVVAVERIRGVAVGDVDIAPGRRALAGNLNVSGISRIESDDKFLHDGRIVFCLYASLDY